MPQVADVKEVRVQTQGFGQGINLQDAPNLLAPTEVRRAENGSLDERGGFTKRLGCLNMGPVGASTDRIISATTFYRGYLQPQLLIHTTAGKIYYTLDPTTNPIVLEALGPIAERAISRAAAPRRRQSTICEA